MNHITAPHQTPNHQNGQFEPPNSYCLAMAAFYNADFTTHRESDVFKCMLLLLREDRDNNLSDFSKAIGCSRATTSKIAGLIKNKSNKDFPIDAINKAAAIYNGLKLSNRLRTDHSVRRQCTWLLDKELTENQKQAHLLIFGTVVRHQGMYVESVLFKSILHVLIFNENLGFRQAAALLGCGINTVHRLCDRSKNDYLDIAKGRAIVNELKDKKLIAAAQKEAYAKSIATSSKKVCTKAQLQARAWVFKEHAAYPAYTRSPLFVATVGRLRGHYHLSYKLIATSFGCSIATVFDAYLKHKGHLGVRDRSLHKEVTTITAKILLLHK